MKVTSDLELGQFTRSHWIFLGSFAASSFLQSVVNTIEDPSYQNSFSGNGSDVLYNNTRKISRVDENTGSVNLIDPNIFEHPGDESAKFFGYILLYYHLLSFILVPIIGGFVEDIGLKEVYMFGIYVAGLTPFLSAILDVLRNQPSFILYSFLVHGVQAVGAVGMQVALYMMITIIFPVQVASIFAVNQAMSILGMIFGGPLAYFIGNLGGFAYRSRTFWTLGGIYVGFALVLKAILPDLPPRETVPSSLLNLIKRYAKFISIPQILLFACSLVVTGIGAAFLQGILSLYIKNYSVGVFGAAVIPLLPALLQLLSPVWGFMLDKLKFAGVIALLGASIVTISFLFVGPAPFLTLEQDLVITCAGLILFGLGQGALIVSSYVLIMKESREHALPQDSVTMTIVSTTFVGAISGGSAIGSLISPFFYTSYGFRTATLLPFLLYFILIPFFVANGFLNPELPISITQVEQPESETSEASALLHS